MPGLEEHRQHLAPQLRRRHLPVQLQLALGDFLFVTDIGFLERAPALVVQIRHVGGTEQRPLAVLHYGLPEQVRNPVCRVHVVSAAPVVAGVLAQLEKFYVGYEEKVAKGELKLYRKMPATQLWRKMLSMLFETGHPWITFKDPCNLRSPQQHAGVVHSSNLCTEITLNTNDHEIAVCNLGSVNMVAHMQR